MYQCRHCSLKFQKNSRILIDNQTMNLEIARKEIVINTHLGPLMHFRLFLGGGVKRLFEAGH